MKSLFEVPCRPSFVALAAALLAILGSCYRDFDFLPQSDRGDASPDDAAKDGSVLTGECSVDSHAEAIAAGFFHACMIRATDSALFCWGDGPALGEPREVMPGTQWRDVSASNSHTCAITQSRELYCWGRNAAGQLGDGGVQDSETPVLVTVGNMSWDSVAIADQRSCAIQVGGAIYCWGAVERCDGSMNGTPARVDLNDDRAYVEVSLGTDHACARDDEGAVTCFGDNSVGQLGQGDTEASHCPLPVPGTWTSIAVGERVSCGISTGDEELQLQCWGRDVLGGMDVSPAPVTAPNGDTWQAVSVGADHRCAITDEAELFCWGNNDYGQLGVSSDSEGTQETPQPVVVVPIVRWGSVSAGGTMTCALAPTGSDITSPSDVFCWGTNAQGQLGTTDGDATFARVCVLE